MMVQGEGYTLYRGDCLEVLPTLPVGCKVVTDPPYGCGKADWDDLFPVEWYQAAKRIAAMIIIITGSSGLKDSIALVGNDFVDVISAWNRNGMTRGPIGYGNWLAAVIACSKPPMGQNFFHFSVCGDMPNHPSPKPLAYMERLIQRVAQPGDVIVDPFMGSGTTGVAAVKHGCYFVGCDIHPDFFDDACQRIEDASLAARGLPKQLKDDRTHTDLPLFAEASQ